jgi:hypothetical protein
MASLPDPTTYDLREIQFFKDEEMKVNFKGADHAIWGFLKHPEKHSEDLIAIRGRPNRDPFSTFVTDKIVFRLFRWFEPWFSKSAQDSGRAICDDNKVHSFTRFFTNTIACAIPISCIVVLYYVQSMQARFGLIAAFSVVFVFCLSVFTNAKCSEVFTSMAA